MQRIRIKQEEKISLIDNLGTMLKAGIPIIEVVGTLKKEAKGNQFKILTKLHKDLGDGKTISSSFSSFPYTFDTVSISLIKAAEEAGTLEETLIDLKQNLVKEMEFSDKVKSALFYPLIIVVVFIAVLLLMLLFVIPRISQVFERLRVELPITTKLLIWMSNFLIDNTLLFIIGSGLLIASTIVLYARNREFFYKIIYHLPLISTLMIQIDVTRFTRSLHLLLSSGLPIITTLELVSKVCMMKAVREAIEKAQTLAQEGHPFTSGLKTKRKLIEPMMIKLMEIGEESGTLEEAMQNVSTTMDYRVSKTLKKVTTMLEPIMLVLIAVIVGSMMLAIISPIYTMIGNVGVR